MAEEEYFDKTAGTEPKATVEENEFKTHDSSSSPSASLSDTEKIASSPSPLPDTEKVKVFNIFGREKKPVYQLLGGGKPADVLLWRKKKESASVVGGATAIWVFFELLGYNFLTFFCYFLMIALAVLFLWSNAHAFIHKTPPEVPKVHIQEEPFLQVSPALRIGINRAFGLLRDIASGKDLKKFLTFISGLWILSVVGSWCNFLTSFYIAVILLHTVPVLYEKYEKKVDAFAEKIVIWTRKKYAVFYEKVVSKIRRGPLKSGKKD